MVEELEELWKKLMFTEEEDIKIELDSRSTKATRDVGKCYVVMKILTQRSINLDASRKNLRMLWKLNKGVQISKLEEEVFLVEFGDKKDKKKVLDMCPWSYEKQLIYNLPLKSRTREIGWAIGSSLGSVLDVDVPESRVQWGKCLCVRVHIDVTRRLVRGRKTTNEGVIQFISGQYDEAIGIGTLGEGSSGEDSNPRRGVVGLAYPMPMSRELPENGKVQKVMEKVEEKETKLGKSSKEKPTTKPDLVEGM
ncbi:hypothetical protein CFP56_042362 [Quercus suber]|uniref:DUF4283 domain-containing protein n=1 Tax=Quercus suber TaxID=58331 RepID=A0AAW0IU23_QUESU